MFNRDIRWTPTAVSGRGYVRMCYATAQPDLEEAFARLERFVQRHRANAPTAK